MGDGGFRKIRQLALVAQFCHFLLSGGVGGVGSGGLTWPTGAAMRSEGRYPELPGIFPTGLLRANETLDTESMLALVAQFASPVAWISALGTNARMFSLNNQDIPACTKDHHSLFVLNFVDCLPESSFTWLGVVGGR